MTIQKMTLALIGTLLLSAGNAYAVDCAGLDWESGTQKAYKIENIFALTVGQGEGSVWGEIHGKITCILDGKVQGQPAAFIDIENAKDVLGEEGFSICKELVLKAQTEGKTLYINNGKGESQVGCSLVNVDKTDDFERYMYNK